MNDENGPTSVGTAVDKAAFWVIIDGFGEVYVWPARKTRSNTIDAFVKEGSISWDQYRGRYGYQCRKANLTWVPTEKAGEQQKEPAG